MGEIINFSLLSQYKLLYIIPTSGNRIYDIWFHNFDEMNWIGRMIQYKENLYDRDYGILSSSCKIQKKFMPVPDYLQKQADGFHHAYLKFEKP